MTAAIDYRVRGVVRQVVALEGNLELTEPFGALTGWLVLQVRDMATQVISVLRHVWKDHLSKGPASPHVANSWG
jgi:hypothetical protein